MLLLFGSMCVYLCTDMGQTQQDEFCSFAGPVADSL